jgi:uncharacterized protein YcgI (DUF1989 family)
MERPVHRHERPIDKAFYRSIRLEIGERPLHGTQYDIRPDTGTLVRAPAGSVIAFELLEGPQIVNVFPWNAIDPDERYWAEETMLIEGSYLQRYTRLWSTMARFRPLVTVIEDTVITLRRLGMPQAFHHFAHGGSGTPADWRAKGGRPNVKSSWERLTEAMALDGVPAKYLTENASLFQKTAIDPVAQTITILPSDAMAGDRVIWFAEIDLTLAVALSPYVGGGVAVKELDGSTRSVRVSVQEQVAEPLSWPNEGVPYPDLGLYLDETGRRDAEVGPTPGIPSRGA